MAPRSAGRKTTPGWERIPSRALSFCQPAWYIGVPKDEIGRGGRPIGFYQSFGEYTGIELFQTPDDETAGSIAIAVYTLGSLRAMKTTKLFTMGESDGDAAQGWYGNRPGKCPGMTDRRAGRW